MFERHHHRQHPHLVLEKPDHITDEEWVAMRNVQKKIAVWDPERDIKIPENPEPLNLKFDDTTAQIYVNNR